MRIKGGCGKNVRRGYIFGEAALVLYLKKKMKM